MIKVVKFGGSSLADAGQFQKVADIIKRDEARKFVVPSAPGKRFSGDTKVTDMLYGCYGIAEMGGEFLSMFEQIKERYREIICGLSLDYSLEDEFDTIQTNFIEKAGRDYAASRGEYLNGLILARYLGYDFIDPAKVIVFDENGRFNPEKTNEILSKELKKHETAVVPGFFGATESGRVVTFSRGGSDITGSIVARAAEATIYENWTDVSGFLMADPRVVENPKPIKTITYRELRELSYMGATVLHEDAIFPVRIAGIPINIRNTNAPEDAGTMIVPFAEAESGSIITGIAGRKGFCVIAIEKEMMNAELGFGRRVLQVLEDNGLSFEHLPSGVDTMCVVVNGKELEGKKDQVVNGICRAVEPESIAIHEGVALLAVVGRGMRNAKGTAAKIFRAITDASVNIRMIDQGSSELNIIIGVQEEDFEKAQRAIYAAFVK
ncbi:MAG: aspartate kinase [Ruminococcaceae bacterium]|nr:aspartate kinase [Oscillospiraceae bacterium]